MAHTPTSTLSILHQEISNSSIFEIQTRELHYHRFAKGSSKIRSQTTKINGRVAMLDNGNLSWLKPLRGPIPLPKME